MIAEGIQERLRALDRRELIGVVVVAVLLVAGVAFWYVRSLPARVQIATGEVPGGHAGPAPAPSPSASRSPGVVVVDVAGWVHHPGVYELPIGARIVDALRVAGGAKRRADLRSLNLAAPLVDGQQIIVVRRGATGPGPPGSTTSVPGASGSGSSSESDGVVNINTATLDELETLSGIGEVLGQRIIDYREQHGPFRTVEDLMNVSGIGDKRFADLKPHITV